MSVCGMIAEESPHGVHGLKMPRFVTTFRPLHFDELQATIQPYRKIHLHALSVAPEEDLGGACLCLNGTVQLPQNKSLPDSADEGRFLQLLW